MLDCKRRRLDAPCVAWESHIGPIPRTKEVSLPNNWQVNRVQDGDKGSLSYRSLGPKD